MRAASEIRVIGAPGPTRTIAANTESLAETQAKSDPIAKANGTIALRNGVSRDPATDLIPPAPLRCWETARPCSRSARNRARASDRECHPGDRIRAGRRAHGSRLL